MADVAEENIDVKSSIIMKVDAPPEDNNTITSQDDTSNKAEQNTSVKIIKIGKNFISTSSPLVMRSSTVSKPKMGSGMLLRPSQLSSKFENKSENNKASFALTPSRLNPLSKIDNLNDTNNCTSTSASNTNSECNTNKIDVNADNEKPKFVPLVTTEPTTKSSSSISSVSMASTSNFVFGQNLHERVISESEASENSDETTASSSCANANGTSELLFSSAAKKTVNADQVNKEVKSLSESAREYEESRAIKRKYDEVVVVTGEEDEKNVLQINCKLFTFDNATGNWNERGRGTLRLNDQEITLNHSTRYNKSRLVVRTSGNLRVVLNTKIWAEMTVDRASPKSLRLTAVDAAGQIKVFLVMASSEEINQLQRLLEIRVKSELERQKELNKGDSEPKSKKSEMDDNLSDH